MTRHSWTFQQFLSSRKLIAFRREPKLFSRWKKIQSSSLQARQDQLGLVLRSTPSNAASPTHRCQARVLQGTETPCQMMRWQMDAQKVAARLAATDVSVQRPIMEACMHPGPLSIFGGVVDGPAQVLFHQGLETALATDGANKNNNEEAISAQLKWKHTSPALAPKS